VELDLEELVPRVYRFALRLTRDRHRAEDLTQETFLRAWRRRQELREPRTARVWLFRIAVNIWRDEVRRGKRPSGHPIVMAADEVAVCSASPVQTIAQREILEITLRELGALPPRQREVLYLRIVEDLSPTEVAEILELSTDTVKVHLSLARKAMRERLQHLFDEKSQPIRPVGFEK
jgi:RNA polymerase sigma-70 factor (ECF subfamily)